MLPIRIGLVMLVAAAFALAQEGLDMDAVRALRDEGKLHFDTAADVDLSPSQRNEHRKKAFVALSKAFKLLDEWCEAHPADSERLEDLMVEIHQMRYWLRKESPIGVLEEDESNVRKGIPPDWPPAPPPDVGPAPGPVPALPPPPPPEAVKDHIRHAEEYAKAHPWDLPGVRDLYLDIVAHTPPGTEAYETALKRAAELDGRLKKAYRLLRNEDPDTLDLSGAETRSLVKNLADDLKHREPDVRKRAAEYLGLLGSGDAARVLVDLFTREKSDEVKLAVLDALSRIGGFKTIRELGRLSGGNDAADQIDALKILEMLAERSEAEGRHASEVVGGFVKAKDDRVAEQALSALEAMGAKGLFGLGAAVQVKNLARRLRVIEALGKTGDGRAAGYLGPFLVFGAKGDLDRQQ
ncbi:MAG: HEAT repeat domain-containing protein, partial [Planctomycetes bacterium]|nr:HEAT repeat domain-containing protein [Planctomycetota bacterium]